MLAALSSLALLSLTSAQVATPPSQAQQQEFLYWHNVARSIVAQSGQCSNMAAIVWDATAAAFSVSNYCPMGDVGLGTYGSNFALATTTCPNSQGLCAQAGNCNPAGVTTAGKPQCELPQFCTDSSPQLNATTACTIKKIVFDGWFESMTNTPYATPNTCLSAVNGGGRCLQVAWPTSVGLGCTYTPNCANQNGGTAVQCTYNPVGNTVASANTNLGGCLVGPACSGCPISAPYCVTSAPFQGLCVSSTTAASMGVTTVLTTVPPNTSTPPPNRNTNNNNQAGEATHTRATAATVFVAAAIAIVCALANF